MLIYENPRKFSMSGGKSTPAKKTSAFDYLMVDGWDSPIKPVQNLLNHITRRTKSEGTKKLYLTHLYKFCLEVGMSPSELVRLRTLAAQQKVQDYADELARRAIPSANCAISALRAFYRANGYTKGRALELTSYQRPSREPIRPEYNPTKPEVYDMADAATSLRDRAIILTLFSTGLRNSTIRALRFLDVKDELVRGLDVIQVRIYTGMKSVDTSACKGNLPYYTFVAEDATRAIRLYLEDRVRRYGSIGDLEPLFCSEYNQIPQEERRKRLISSRELQYVVKDCARRGNLGRWELVRPHSLRHSFRAILRQPLSDGTSLDYEHQEWLMGHKNRGSAEAYYDSSKVEELRVLYSRAKFGRVVIENKFMALQEAISRQFEGSGVDTTRLVLEYAAKLRSNTHFSTTTLPSDKDALKDQPSPI